MCQMLSFHACIYHSNSHTIYFLAVNNAGTINKNNNLWEVPAEEFDTVIDTNVKGVANMLRHFIPVMIERKHGIIVNMSSGWGRSAAAQVNSCVVIFCSKLYVQCQYWANNKAHVLSFSRMLMYVEGIRVLLGKCQKSIFQK